MTNLERIELFTCKHRKRHPHTLLLCLCYNCKSMRLYYTSPSIPCFKKTHASPLHPTTQISSNPHILLSFAHIKPRHPPQLITSYPYNVIFVYSPSILSSTNRQKFVEIWEERKKYLFSPTQKFRRDNFTVDRIIVASKGGGDVVALHSSL